MVWIVRCEGGGSRGGSGNGVDGEVGWCGSSGVGGIQEEGWCGGLRGGMIPEGSVLGAGVSGSGGRVAKELAS